MKWIDLLRMSGGNLKRRKLRTFLTVLGVVIGVASIVVMLSLGIGLQEAMTQEVTNQVGGATTIQVTGSESTSSQMVYFDDPGTQTSDSENAKKHVTDDDIPLLMDLEHVTFAAPVLSIYGILISGNYISWTEIQGITPEYFDMLGIELEGGELPPQNQQNLQLVVGNLIPTNFYNERTGSSPYYETGELPVDVLNDQIFAILDEEAYYNSQGTGDVDPLTGTAQRVKPPKKHLLTNTGLVAGGPEAYSQASFSCYADLSTLLNVMKKEFAGKPFPGQPTTAAGKPLKYIAYSYISIQVDDMENVEDTMNLLRDMGYSVSSNMEYIESMKSVFLIVQAVLGGIGAISLLVAAIGIANTMMMSIYERTKEIGVIKVLGCSLKNIKQLFLLEAAFIGLLGGIIGNLLSYMLSFIINQVVAAMGEGAMGFAGNISSIPLWLTLLSSIFALLVGMIAGFFPALRAMRLSPLAAIRND